MKTVPFGWAFYFLVFIIFRLLNMLRLNMYYKFRMNDKQKRQKQLHVTDRQNYLKTRKAARKKLKRFDSFMCFLYEIKSFGFNLFVLDLSLGCYYEIAATDINLLFKYSAEDPTLMVSIIISKFILVFLFYDFWELFVASNRARLSKQAEDFLKIGSMLKKREDFEKEYDIENLPSDLNVETEKEKDMI